LYYETYLGEFVLLPLNHLLIIIHKSRSNKYTKVSAMLLPILLKLQEFTKKLNVHDESHFSVIVTLLSLYSDYDGDEKNHTHKFENN